MANIPVEKTSAGLPWWLWPLGLLLLGLLLWFVIGALNDDDEVAVVDDPDVVAVDEPIGEPLNTSTAGATMAGAALELSSLYVTRVPGDNVFFVAPTEGGSDETLVILDPTPSPDVPGIEGQVDINPGQRVDLSDGTLGELGQMSLTNMGLSDDELNAMSPTSQVIRIDGGDIEISNADLQNVEVDEM